MTVQKRIVPNDIAHTTVDDNQLGLPGAFGRPIKVTLLGAGSLFTSRVLNDLLRVPGAERGEIALVDIDAERLGLMQRIIEKLLVERGRPGWRVTASTDRCKVLPGSHYIVNCIEVSGLQCVEHDNDIPLKYGVDQCIGDTIGPGGLFKALRTVPVFLDALRDAAELCPEALVLNYTNPMAILCLAAGRSSPMSVVGLCHSVQDTSHHLAEMAGVPYAEMEWDCAGINHLAWFTKLRHQGQDLYPRLRKRFEGELRDAIAAAERGEAKHDDADPYAALGDEKAQRPDLIRKDMCLHFGAYITESSGHLSEYVPYYRKSAQGRQLLRQGYSGGSRFYATNWPRWRQEAETARNAILRGEQAMDWPRSWEYAAWIIEAREKDVPHRIYGNVMNRAAGHSPGGELITNLPGDGCVEVACMVDRNGVHPCRFGALPAQMAALCDANMRMFDLAAQACIERSKEAAIHALLLDPLTAAVCTPAQIKAMALELFDAERDFLPGYR